MYLAATTTSALQDHSAICHLAAPLLLSQGRFSSSISTQSQPPTKASVHPASRKNLGLLQGARTEREAQEALEHKAENITGTGEIQTSADGDRMVRITTDEARVKVWSNEVRRQRSTSESSRKELKSQTKPERLLPVFYKTGKTPLFGRTTLGEVLAPLGNCLLRCQVAKTTPMKIKSDDVCKMARDLR